MACVLNGTTWSEILSSKILLAKPCGLHLSSWLAMWRDIIVMLYRGHSLLTWLLEANWATSHLAIWHSIELSAIVLKLMLLITQVLRLH